MADHILNHADERAHAPDGHADWEESWYFDFVAADGRLGGYARLGLRAAERRAWWWSAVVGSDLPLVLVRDHDVDPPRRGTLEIRGSGLWGEPICETPFDHWSLGLEAFALGLDDPVEAYGAERGDPVPLGFDLEWEAAAGPSVVPEEAGRRYRQLCAVHGEVLVGHQRFAVSGGGTREHAWGRRDWWTSSFAWVAGRLDDGTAIGPGLDPEPAVVLDDRGLVAGGRAGSARLVPVAHAPLQVPAADGRTSRLARALCRAEADGGRRGWAWAERLQPASSTTG